MRGNSPTSQTVRQDSAKWWSTRQWIQISFNNGSTATSLGKPLKMCWVKYLTLTLRLACRLRVSFAVAGVGDIHCWIFVTQDDPSLIQHKKALQPLSLCREPRHSSCFPRPKLFSYNKHGLYFTVGRYLAFPAVCFFPFLSQLSLVSILLLLWPVVCSRVGGSQPLISYRFFC